MRAPAWPLRFSVSERVKVPLVTPQLVEPDSTPPFTAMLLPATELDELGCGATDDAATELGTTGATELDARDDTGATLAGEPEHKLPVKAGRSAEPPCLST